MPSDILTFLNKMVLRLSSLRVFKYFSLHSNPILPKAEIRQKCHLAPFPSKPCVYHANPADWVETRLRVDMCLVCRFCRMGRTGRQNQHSRGYGSTPSPVSTWLALSALWSA